jgi:hypothetical protein
MQTLVVLNEPYCFFLIMQESAPKKCNILQKVRLKSVIFHKKVRLKSVKSKYINTSKITFVALRRFIYPPGRWGGFGAIGYWIWAIGYRLGLQLR